MGPDAMLFVFWMLSFKPAFSLSSFTFIKRLFNSSSFSAIRVVSSAYLRLLIVLLAILILACALSSPAYKLESDNTKEVIPLLWSFRTPCQASQPGDLTKGLGIPREPDFEGQQDFIKDFHRTGGSRDSCLGQYKQNLCTPRLRGKEQWFQETEPKYLLVLAGLLWRSGLAGAYHRDGGLAAAVWEGPLWCKPSWRSPWIWRLGCLRSENYQRGSPTPPINR